MPRMATSGAFAVLAGLRGACPSGLDGEVVVAVFGVPAPEVDDADEGFVGAGFDRAEDQRIFHPGRQALVIRGTGPGDNRAGGLQRDDGQVVPPVVVGGVIRRVMGAQAQAGGFEHDRLQHHVHALAFHDVQQRQGRAFWLLGAAFELRDVAGGEVEVAGEGGLA